jgi:hypothetical protein
MTIIDYTFYPCVFCNTGADICDMTDVANMILGGNPCCWHCEHPEIRKEIK